MVLCDLPQIGHSLLRLRGELRPRRVYGGGFAYRSRPRHGTDHDLKPLPLLPGFCLPAGPLQCRQEEHRSGRTTAQGFGRNLSRCHLPAPGYDQLPERRFELIPFWGFLVFLLYSMIGVGK